MLAPKHFMAASLLLMSRLLMLSLISSEANSLQSPVVKSNMLTSVTTADPHSRFVMVQDKDLIETDPSIRIPSSNARAVVDWKRCLVPRPWESPHGVDQSIYWDRNDDCQQVATMLLCQLGLSDDSNNATLLNDLTSSLQKFTNFCQDNLHQGNEQQFKARVVSSRGLWASAKCPLWHIDNLPVRWIQSLAGPGVMWAHPNPVIWSAFTNLRSGGGMVSNADRLNKKSAVIYQAKEGEAILLRGNLWHDLWRCSSSPDCSAPPVVHKSPDRMLPWEGRVLLTMDVEFN